MAATQAPELLQQLATEPTNPSEQLLGELLRLRQRDVPFELAWRRATRSIRWPQKTETRRAWKTAIADCQGYWEDCYCNPGVRLTLDQIIEAMSFGSDLIDEEAA